MYVYLVVEGCPIFNTNILHIVVQICEIEHIYIISFYFKC